MAKSTLIKIFKIRRTTDNLFSTGGISPHFDEKGKAWTTLGGLKNHINLVLRSAGAYLNCEVVTIELTPKILDVIPVDKIFAEQLQKKAAKEQRIKNYYEDRKRDEELAELTRLQQKYGK